MDNSLFVKPLVGLSLKGNLTMVKGTGISGVRNGCLTEQKNNYSVSNDKNEKERDVSHARSVTTDENTSKVHQNLGCVADSHSDLCCADVAAVLRPKDTNPDDYNITSDKGITDNSSECRERREIHIDLTLLYNDVSVHSSQVNGCHPSDAGRGEELSTVDDGRAGCDVKTKHSENYHGKAKVRKNAEFLGAISEEKEQYKRQTVLVGNDDVRQEINFDDLTLDDRDILRTSTPTGDPTVRFAGKQNCVEHYSSARSRNSSAGLSHRPKSSLTSRRFQSSPATSVRFNNFVNRPSTSRTRPSTGATSMSNSTRRLETKRSFKITKEDLDYYLPKKSFFNSHDKALKDAGYEVEEVSPAGAKKRQFMQILQQRNRERIERDRAKNMPPPKVLGLLDLYELECSGEEPHSSSIVSFEDQQTHNKSKKNVKAALRKKNDIEQEEIHVDYQLLLIYLRYIKDSPEEFLSKHLHMSESENLVYVRPGDSIVKMGSVFQRGRHGISTENILVTAVHDIRPRFTDPGQWANANKEKELLALTSTKKENSFPSKPEAGKKEASNSQEEPKSEFERIKVKLDGWLKTVTTAQLNKAKELALKDLGQEDISLSRWWVSLKSCNYIRQLSRRS